MDALFSLIMNRRFQLAVGIALVIWLIYLVGFRWRPETQVRLHTMALLESVSRAKFDRTTNLISEDYEGLGFNKADTVLMFRELRRFFIFVEIQPQEPDVVTIHDRKNGEFAASIRWVGQGQYPAELIVTEANRIKSPFVFRWQKTGAAPWKWQLVEITNETSPNFRGYRPGDVLGSVRKPRTGSQYF